MNSGVGGPDGPTLSAPFRKYGHGWHPHPPLRGTLSQRERDQTSEWSFSLWEKVARAKRKPARAKPQEKGRMRAKSLLLKHSENSQERVLYCVPKKEEM